MARRDPAGEQLPSPIRTIARLFLELASFSILLFATRFIARAHLTSQIPEECTIGAVAIDILAHGVRFPIVTYAPNGYENGFFFSGLLTAASFSMLGSNVLARKLVTHVIMCAGAVGALWLLRACLQELGLTDRRVRWAATTVLVIAFAFAPLMVTVFSMFTVGIGSHMEGSAINAILLAVFSHRIQTRSPTHTAVIWALVGFVLYLCKGTALMIPVLVAAELIFARRSPSRLAAALGGFLFGQLPELQVMAQRHDTGWGWIVGKAQRNSRKFPDAFLASVWFLAAQRSELITIWGLAMIAGLNRIIRSANLFLRISADPSVPDPKPPATLGIVVAVAWLHLAALTLMAQGPFDYYTMYIFPPLAVLHSVLVAVLYAQAIKRWGEGAGAWGAAAAIALTLFLYRPEALGWGWPTVSGMWRNQASAACAWRLADGFGREHDYGLAPPGLTREQHVIERCRSLSGQDQILDCIGGMAFETHFRGTRVAGEPPAPLNPSERRAYAFYYGMRRRGDTTPCRDFVSPDLTAECAAAVQLECLILSEPFVQGPPRCTIPPPPMDGYWAARRSELLAKVAGVSLDVAGTIPDSERRACQVVLQGCY